MEEPNVNINPLITLLLLAGGAFLLSTHFINKQDTQAQMQEYIQDLRLHECQAEYRGFREGAK
ncbi:hypothetical protein AMR41_30735 [Hapalosiphon sp. MRB220]|nr:hypothetical protein AMR41_30735 [Hapalosiphon sp. MRB220]